ncbi:MAG: endo alpha-1,4 polygalactosaminidase [Pseudomonadota bacterium]|nr:endo alpha-1,4 polygalactosaminidase [Pseudomonadota bacterium]
MHLSLSLISALLLPLPTDGGNLAPDWYQPASDVHWQAQLQGPLNTGYDAELYIVDLFDTDTSVIRDLQAADKKVICYFSAGTHENWRPDRHRFLPTDKGRRLGNWPGERWLDIRSLNVRQRMADRIRLAAEKGCDGVDPDNVDGYTNNTGFPLKSKQQLDYNRFLFDTAHQYGLAVSLKNNLGQVDALIDHVDFAVNESCHQWRECHLLKPFIDAGKPVLHIDYLFNQSAEERRFHCDHMNLLGFRSLTLPLALDDSFRFSCF